MALVRVVAYRTRVLTGGFVLACGWGEDVAARRKPTLLPGGRAARMGA
ncbi:hypothetical protein ABTY20_09840 [Streptomyces sp. NPDC126497]